MICDFLNVFSFGLSMLGPDSLQWSRVERGPCCFLTWKWDPGQVAQPPTCWFSFLYLFVVVVGLRCCAALLSLQQAGATLYCGAQAPRCGGFSFCRAQALGARASVVTACGLSRPTACVIFLDQEVCPPNRQAASQPLGHQGSPSVSFLRVKWGPLRYQGPLGILWGPHTPPPVLF